ncbi:MAG: hypothetical protein Q8865_09425 [Bacillota bacterium]|nr:hypothetical protein [Bacillota bacterium]
MCVNRAQTVSVFKSNDKVFKRSVEIFEQFYDDIKLNPYSKKYYISDRMYAEDIKNITNDYKLSKGYPAELLQCLKYIFETLKFTDFIIEENHTYQIQQRIMGDDTEVGAIYSPNKLHKYNIEGNWYYHYRRDRYSHENKYVGRWLYDLLYN